MTLFRKCGNEVRTLCRCYCNVENATRTLQSHPYCIPSFTNYAELTDLLLKNVIYKNNGLLILNRPHGLRKVDSFNERGFWQKKIKLSITPSNEAIDKLSFTGVLPYLMKALKFKHLQLLRAPDRHMSGVSILSYNKNIVPQRVRKAFNPPHIPKYTHLAVCGGIPTVENNSIKLGITLTERNSTKRLTFVEKLTQRSIALQKVYPLTVNHRVLATNKELKVSLIELETTKNRWNGVRAFCAMRLLSPALGDSMFGSCVQEIQKTRIAVDPFSPAANKPYRIPKHVLEAIGLEFQQQSVIPLHLHLAKLNFLRYRTDGRMFTAKPPDHFCWTCEKLGLAIPEEYLENRVSDRLSKSKNVETAEEEDIDSISNDDDSEDESHAPMGKSSQRASTNYEDIYLDFEDTRTSRTEFEKKS